MTQYDLACQTDQSASVLVLIQHVPSMLTRAELPLNFVDIKVQPQPWQTERGPFGMLVVNDVDVRLILSS